MQIIQLTEETKNNIMENLLKRSPNNYDEYQDTVNEILQEVRTKGDEAVFAYTKKFDKADITKENLYVTEDEIKEAYAQVDDPVFSRKTGAKQLVSYERRRRYFRTACYRSKQRRSLCTGGESSISVQRTDEYYSC